MKTKRISKTVALLLSVVLIFVSVPTFSIFADDVIVSGTCGDNLNWTLYEDGHLIIFGTGEMYDYYIDDPPWYNSYLDTINAVEFEGEVTRIGSYAFSDCPGLTSITIPEGITSIGNAAFSNCPGLTSITIPDSVTSIGNWAFNYCTGLTSITIPDSVTSIGHEAFYCCSELENITVDGGNKYYHSAGNCLIETASKTLVAGCKNSIIPNDASVTSIGGYAFYGCTGLTSITIPDSVTSIGNLAFEYCTGLTSITIPEGVTSIGHEAFCGCTGLTSITIPESVTSIGSDAFCHCTGLTSITIPEGVNSIGVGAFYNCSGLTTVYYNGTQEQRNQISIESNNTYLTGAEWIYNCTAEKAEKCETLRNVYLKTAIQKKSGAKPTDSSYNLRLISMLDLLSDYSEVGFYITIEGYNDGENDEPIKYSTDTVYTSFLNGSTRVNASDYGAGYFSLVNITVPNEYYSSNIKIKPYIVFADGTEFSGNEINTTVSKYIK